MLREGVLSAGLRPAPATSQGNGRSNSNSDSGLSGGWRGGSGCGRRRKPRFAVRPSRWRLCVRALAKQCFASKAPSSWGLGRGIHAADTPATGPAPPSTDLRDLSARGVRSVFRRKTDLTPEFHSISDRCVDQGRHLPTAARNKAAVANSRVNLSKAGRCGAAGPLAPWMAPSSPHGRVYGVSCPPGMGLRRVLPTHTAPPSHGMHAVAVAVGVAPALALASAGAGRSPAEPPQMSVGASPYCSAKRLLKLAADR